MSSSAARVVLVGSGALADAVADAMAGLAPNVALERVDSDFAPGRTFDLLLDADLVIDASNDATTRYLANDAAAIRAIPMIWVSVSSATGQVGIAWDERGADYRDFAPEEPGDRVGDPSAAPGVVDAVAALAGQQTLAVLAGDAGPLVIVWESGQTREIPLTRDPAGQRPGSLEERTALREPDPARSVSAEQLAKLLAGPTTEGIHETPPLLLDVRERPEASFTSLPGSVLIPFGELPDRLSELPGPDTSIVVYCHHGVRSARALEVLEKAGFTRARHLTGGIDAWSVKVDPEVPRY